MEKNSMKKLHLISTFFAIALLSAGFISCGSTSTAVAEGSASSGTSDGSNIFIILDSNPSTGYSWTYNIEDKSIVASVSDNFVQNNSGSERVGAGGIHTFILQGKKEGRTQVVFTYARANASPSQKRVYEVTVDSNLSTGLKLLSAE